MGGEEGGVGSLDARLVFTLAGSHYGKAPPPLTPGTDRSLIALQVGWERNIPPRQTWGAAATLATELAQCGDA